MLHTTTPIYNTQGSILYTLWQDKWTWKHVSYESDENKDHYIKMGYWANRHTNWKIVCWNIARGRQNATSWREHASQCLLGYCLGCWGHTLVWPLESWCHWRRGSRLHAIVVPPSTPHHRLELPWQWWVDSLGDSPIHQRWWNPARSCPSTDEQL